MYPHVPQIGQLATLVAVDERRSIAAAARDLGLSQQTVSARVAAAEKTLGVAVFRRGVGGSEPTERGRVVLTAARELLSAAGEFSRAVSATTQPDAVRSLPVAVSNTIAELYFPSWAARFHRENPTVRLQLRSRNSTEVCDAVAGGECVLGFVEGAEVSHGLASDVVGVDDLILVVPPTHSWAGSEVDAGQLRRTPLVTRERGSGSREIVEAVLGTIAEPAGEFGSLSAQRAAVTGMGEPTVIAARAVESQVSSGELVRVPVKGVTFRRLLRAVYPRGRPLGVSDPDAEALLRIAKVPG
ncbi:Putative transcriptional regulator, LysR-family [Corynebacterium glyciniphilum AJ 3170]|uniref:Putative transcriptional regulator, LysR-family n=1 Tax=Corynebacterium glyciniphilum AJ 3170 TaxID=1404245 RepID=X5DJP7_9CORY|nr:LysR family transcriptional regulator [Corynebacterium glyciniphilum]AHW63298.1 Putative transcriptional regulator, LysR-family [Corynebacterium glyciniphilum AJ 3170]